MIKHQPADCRLLIVDDEPLNIRLLEDLLDRSEYTNHRSTTNPLEVVPLFLTYQPDLILLDLMMPRLDGYAVIQQLQPLIPPGSFLPILVLTGDPNPETRRHALAVGATDLVNKPFDITEVLLRIANLLEMRSLHRALEEDYQVLESRVRERTRDLEMARLEILERLARAAEYRDDDTGEHTKRVGAYTRQIAAGLGLHTDECMVLQQVAPLHDIGKIGIPDTILLKPTRLTPEEFAAIRTHTAIGAGILSGSQFPALQTGEVIARWHHERWDGTGYPDGLEGEEIPLAARIVMVADVYDALTYERPYKPAWSAERALEELQRGAGTQFDPQVVDIFLATQEDPSEA